jgi:hypothetical protein
MGLENRLGLMVIRGCVGAPASSVQNMGARHETFSRAISPGLSLSLTT